MHVQKIIYFLLVGPGGATDIIVKNSKDNNIDPTMLKGAFPNIDFISAASDYVKCGEHGETFIFDSCSHTCLRSVMREIIFYKTKEIKTAEQNDLFTPSDTNTNSRLGNFQQSCQ
jgi:hypothetical protein